METDNTTPCTETNSELIEAVLSGGQTESVKALLAAGADINTKGENSRSALAFASQEGYTDIVNILLDNGASDESRDNDYGRTPLWLAAAKGQTDVVRALVSAGADVNTQRNDGISALGIASQEGYTEVAKMLLDNGAQIGHTPLFSLQPMETLK